MVSMSHIHKAVTRDDLFPCDNIICSLIWNVNVPLHALKSQGGDVIDCFNAMNNQKLCKSQLPTNWVMGLLSINLAAFESDCVYDLVSIWEEVRPLSRRSSSCLLWAILNPGESPYSRKETCKATTTFLQAFMAEISAFVLTRGVKN